MGAEAADAGKKSCRYACEHGIATAAPSESSTRTPKGHLSLSAGPLCDLG